MTSAQVRMARAALNWTVRELAEATGLHRNTINNIEVGRYAGDPDTLKNIEKVLNSAGVEFIDENGGGPGVRLRKPHMPQETEIGHPPLCFAAVRAGRGCVKMD